MATDTRADARLTIGDLCQAIAGDEVAYTLRDGEYEVTGLALRRLRRARRPLTADHRDVPPELLYEPHAATSEMGSLA